MKEYGLIGKTLKHSFSKNFFTEKFQNEKIDAHYELFELPEIAQFASLVKEHELYGLNVTIPYKEEVMQFLDELDPIAQGIGAVNTVKFIRTGETTKLKGYNTDIIGFTDSIRPHLKEYHKKALVLGSGGAAKAIHYALHLMGIETKTVSRNSKEGCFTYDELNDERNKAILDEYLLIINCSPAGMFPNVEQAPNIPYGLLTDRHFLYDLVYNPILTKFCELGEKQGAFAMSGLEMLHGQAIASWKIWNE